MVYVFIVIVGIIFIISLSMPALEWASGTEIDFFAPAGAGSTNLLFWISLAVVSFAALVAVFVIYFRRRRNSGTMEELDKETLVKMAEKNRMEKAIYQDGEE